MTSRTTPKAPLPLRLKVIYAAIAVLMTALPFVLYAEFKNGKPTNDEVVRVVEGAGYTNVRVGQTGTNILIKRCGDGGFTHHTGFLATDQRGREISGKLCSGWLTGKAVFLD